MRGVAELEAGDRGESDAGSERVGEKDLAETVVVEAADAADTPCLLLRGDFERPSPCRQPPPRAAGLYGGDFDRAWRSPPLPPPPVAPRGLMELPLITLSPTRNDSENWDDSSPACAVTAPFPECGEGC